MNKLLKRSEKIGNKEGWNQMKETLVNSQKS